jgi:hypothetical protein
MERDVLLLLWDENPSFGLRDDMLEDDAHVLSRRRRLDTCGTYAPRATTGCTIAIPREAMVEALPIPRSIATDTLKGVDV